MAYTNFQNCTANEYKNIVYNQETNNKIKVLFNNVELEDADEYCESFEVVSRVIPNGSKTFMLENLVSQEATLVLHNIDTSIIQDQVSISIGTLVSENTYEYVPIGIYNLQEIPTTDNGKTTIKLRDNSVKLDFNYNAKPLIDEHGGTATKLQILQDICSKANITCNVSSFIGSSDLIGIYDNTITGRQYVAYLAGSAGAIPIITRSGALDFKYLNNLSIIQIPIEIVEQYSNAENFKISRVVYEDAIRKYESGNENYDTLFLDSANPYISSQEQIASIYNIVNNFEINSFKTGRILGNPAIDSYDLIQITDYDGTIFKTFANNTLRYNGKMINTFASEISFERKKENVSLKSGATFKKWAKTEIDNANAQITIQAGQIEEIEEDIQNPTSTKQGTSIDIEDALDSPLIDFKMYGDTQQDSTTGVNKLPPMVDKTASNNNIDLTNDNGVYTLKGTTSSTASNITKSLNGEYTIQSGDYLHTGNDTTSSALSMGLLYNGTQVSSPSLSLANRIIDLSSYAGSKVNQIRFYTTANSTVNMVVKPMIVNSSSATDFEKYTGGSPAPSPSYPQPIQVVTGRNDINVCGKNLFDDYKTKTATYKGIEVSNDDNGVKLNGTYDKTGNTDIWLTENRAGIYYNQDKLLLLKANTTYTISVSLYSGTYTSTQLNFVMALSSRNVNDLSFTYNYQQLTKNGDIYSKTFTTGDTDIYAASLRITTSTSYDYTFSNAVFQIQIEKSSTATTYEPYTGYTQEINLGSIELCKIGTYQDYIYKTNDKWYIHKEIGGVVLDGSESWGEAGTSVASGTKRFYYDNNTFYNSGLTNDNIYALSPQFIGLTWYGIYSSDTTTKNAIALYDSANKQGRLVLRIDDTYASDVATFKTWLSTHNTSVYYVLANSTETEITNSELVGQLNALMSNPLLKGLNHITNDTANLYPNLFIEYFRDTNLNANFVSKDDMTKYYTKIETDAKLTITSGSIMSEVSRVESKTDANNEYTSRVETSVTNLQTDTTSLLTFKQDVEQNGVQTLKNTLIQADINGLSITKGENFKNIMTDRNQKIESNGKEIMFMGYDESQNRNVARIDDIESKRATIGVHRCETLTRNNKKRTAWFYVGGGN